MNNKLFSCLLIAGLATLGAQAQESHQYIDFGLPSGTLWAVENIDTDAEMTWYTGLDNPKGDDVFKLGECIQGTANDPATAAWGEEWCTPTLEQWWELLHYVRYDATFPDYVRRVRYYDSDGDGVFDTPDPDKHIEFSYPNATYNQNKGSYYFGAYWTATQIMDSWPLIAPTDTCFEWYCNGIDVSDVIDMGIHPYSEHGYIYNVVMTNLGASVELVIGSYTHKCMIRPVRKEKSTGVNKVRKALDKNNTEYRLGKIIITGEGDKFLDM